MAEQSSFEHFSGAANAAEQTAEQREAAAAAARKAAAAAKQAKKQEARARQKDDTLAHIVVAFLRARSAGSADPLGAALTALLARNAPSEMLLGVLSLISAEAAKAVQATDDFRTAAKESQQAKKEKGAIFPPSVKVMIDTWVAVIGRAAAIRAKRALFALRDGEGNTAPELSAFFAHVLAEFLRQKKAHVPPIQNLHQFGNAVFEKVFAALEESIANTKALGSGAKQ